MVTRARVAGSKFERVQRAHFERADDRHFVWQTRGPGFAVREARLLALALAPVTRPLLEIGCGEGGNLFHLLALPSDGGPGPLIGLDAFPARVGSARRALAGARFACADAGALPFADASFRTVLIRDVLHHLPQPARAVAEAVRVLVPGGRLVLLEPNARNPLIRLQMALVPAERGAARLDAAFLRALVADLPLTSIEQGVLAPLPIERALLHPDLGLPRLGRLALMDKFLDGCERAATKLLPSARWSTLMLRARRA